MRHLIARSSRLNRLALIFSPILALALVTLSPFAGTASAASQELQFGAGVHYMDTVGDIKDSEQFDSSALNVLIALKRAFELISVEVDSEWSLDFGGSDKTLWMPQAFGLIGSSLYGGAGIGTGYIYGEWFDNPIYTLRAGFLLPLESLTVDINANYQFMSSKALENLDSDDWDSVTFGAVLWF